MMTRQEIEDNLKYSPAERHGSKLPEREARYPTHVVVDTRDGYTWAKDANGDSFTQLTATAFARQMNQDSKPGHQTYALFALVPQHVRLGGSYTLSDDGKVVYPL